MSKSKKIIAVVIGLVVIVIVGYFVFTANKL